MFRLGIVVLIVFFGIGGLQAQLTTEGAILVSPGAATPPDALIIKPAPVEPVVLSPKESPLGVDWTGVFAQSALFLTIEHSFRLGTEAGTRAASGSFFKGYMKSVTALHGLADGDEFYVNYVGHPMEGAVSGFLWSQNDRKYRSAEFGRDSRYWKGRLRAGAFAWVYSTQFEIGPISEASIGQIQAQHPQYGFVDHIMTPALGMAWMIGEDVIDKYVVKQIEDRVRNHYIRLFARGTLNPARSFSNALRFKAPWHRDTRSGIYVYGIRDQGSKEPKAKSTLAPANPPPGVAPFEFTLQANYRSFLGQAKGNSCVGGSSSAAVRVAEKWQLLFDMGGCKLINTEKNFSGDSLHYLAGARWSPAPSGRWGPHVQFLLGGNKYAQELMSPERKLALQLAAQRQGTDPPVHNDYTLQWDANGLALATGAGLDVKLNSAITFRVADLDYFRSWTRNLNGSNYSNSLQVTTGLVLRMGTW